MIKIEKKTTKKEKLPIKILKQFLRIIEYAFFIILAMVLLLFIYINLPVSPGKEKAQIGVTFSLRYAQDIGLDWRQTYLAILDELNIRYIRIPIYWDLIEKNQNEYNFSDIDWQLEQAAQRGVNVILVIGQKVPRWPECFIPKWIESDNVRKTELLEFEKIIIERYKNGHSEITSWQIENEPFLNFGVCPDTDADLLDNEIAEVKKIDSSRPIIITDSGELSLWVQAAKRADIFGTTMYREVYSAKLGHWRYPIGPNFFKFKMLLIKLFAQQKNTIVIELQGEPWVQGWTTDAPIEKQLASMNASILADNVEFAKKTGIKEIYVWGAEWWYWMKTKQNNATLWETARSLVQQ
jgi:hypothetical protein